MSSFERFSTPTFAAFAWAALNLASGSGLAASVRVLPFTAAQRGDVRHAMRGVACGSERAYGRLPYGAPRGGELIAIGGRGAYPTAGGRGACPTGGVGDA